MLHSVVYICVDIYIYIHAYMYIDRERERERGGIWLERSEIGLCRLKNWRRQWQLTPVPLPGESHGRRSLVGCSPWCRTESDTTERLHYHFTLSCIREGSGNPLQCSCLENPRDGGAWWAAVYGVAQSRTRLKRLSSSRLKITEVIILLLLFPSKAR